MRLFTAFEPPPAIRQELVRLQKALSSLPFRRWQSPDTLHLTLHFLGEVDPRLLEPLTERLQEVCRSVSAFRLELGELGAFPSPRRPRTLWVGVGGERERLLALEAALRPQVAAFGIPLEARPYSPHITLARDPVAPVTIPDLHPRPGIWEASELVLFHSALERRGAIHTPIARFPLA